MRHRLALVLTLAGTLALGGCWTTTTLDTAKNPPPPATVDRWQLMDELSGQAGGTLDDTGLFRSTTAGRTRCPYALNTTPVATRKWFWDIFMPIAYGNYVALRCDNGQAMNIDVYSGKASAQRFAQTWHQLAHTPDATSGLPEFEKLAIAWRALPERPAMSESQRQYKVAAEAAVREKKWDVAAQQYRKALAVDEAWPQGHFNLALLYAEIGLYESAGIEMRKYLMLVPDAENARQSQDKIYEWQAKLGAR